MRWTCGCLAAIIGLAAAAARADSVFAIDAASPTTGGGVISSADVLGFGPTIVQSAGALGLTPGADFLSDVSNGQDKIVPNLLFTVDRTAIGASGTAVNSAFLGGDPAFNIYKSNLAGANQAAVSGSSLGLVPGFFGDAVTAVGHGIPGTLTYFTLDPSSLHGSLASDILVSNGGGSFGIFASAAVMGLRSDDQIDGLVLDVAHNTALFSLTSFSPSTFTSGLGGSLSPGDILETHFTGSFTLFASASQLGLRDDDNVVGINTVPEPASGWLLLLGAGACGLLVARTRRSAWNPAERAASQ
jgi:PEP-CTERM motif